MLSCNVLPRLMLLHCPSPLHLSVAGLLMHHASAVHAGSEVTPPTAALPRPLFIPITGQGKLLACATTPHYKNLLTLSCPQVKANFSPVRLSAMEDFIGRGDRRIAKVGLGRKLKRFSCGGPF